VCSVCSNQEVEIDLDLDFLVTFAKSSFASRYCKPCLVILEVGTREFVIEVEFNVRHGLQFVQESFVKSSSIDGKICLREH